MRAAPRIAMVTSVFLPSVGGIQTQSLDLARALVRAGAQVRIVTRWHPGTAPSEWMEGVQVIRVGRGDAPRAIATGSFVAAATAYLVAHRAELDVVHAHQLLSPTTVALSARALTGIPVVLNPHACGPLGDVGVLRRTASGRLRLRAARAFGDAFVSISPAIHAELRDTGVAETRIQALPNGVDTVRFAPASAGERHALRSRLGLGPGPLAVYAGRLAPEKGVDVLLAAWRQVVEVLPAATLVILGDGEERTRVFRAAASTRGIVLGGPVADVAQYLRAADVSVLPSRTEGLPVALLEAMACGLRCVATRTPGAEEVLGPGETGWRVAPEEPAALASALVEALGSQDRRRGEAARARVLERYAIDAVAGRYLALYRRLMPVAGRPAVEPAR